MKRNGKKSRKIRKLILACTLSAVVLIVSTYTWFIGIQTVRVSPFEITIATTEGLFLSMDGEEWVYNLDINTAKKYDGNTNIMPTLADGTANKLAPISTVGELDSTVSRMKLFEKSSLTTTPGGYRLLSSRINNNTYVLDEDGDPTEELNQGSGYIVFDLFVKNLSGTAYYHKLEPKNEEAIYLTYDSAVKVDSTGTSDPQEQTGIENSIRVGFAQIGRVEATTTTATTITGMNCTGTNMTAEGYTYTKGDVTGICRNAQIWEPNDTDHEQNAKNWFTKSCITRKAAGSDVTLPASYNVAQPDADPAVAATYCAFPTSRGTEPGISTYAIRDEIKIEGTQVPTIDVYDGHNGYAGNTYNASTNATGKLVDFDYFTDTEKNLKSTNRPQFMTLAPNSITKVRVYIWLEGQDLDNYDFAQLGQKVKINFGFTKERFVEENHETTDKEVDLNADGVIDDKDYKGPALATSDNADLVTATPEASE